jgi:nucleotide-binding universal stress UspA family protein
MYDDILLPTDGSSGTAEALSHALAIGGDQDARIHVLYVVESRLYRAADDETKDDVRRTLEEEGDRALEDARVRIADAGLDCVTESREGIPKREITGYADEAGVDLVVMGTHLNQRGSPAVHGGRESRKLRRANNTQQPGQLPIFYKHSATCGT